MINLSKRLGYYYVMKALYNEEDIINVTNIYLKTKKLLHLYKNRINFYATWQCTRKKTIGGGQG